MDSIDFSQFVSAGYLLIQAGNSGWDQLSTGLLPAELVSLSNCISQKFDIVWGWTPNDKTSALEFGIDETRWHEYLAWCQGDYKADMDIWSMFYSPDAARRIAKRFVGKQDHLHLIGVGLPVELAVSNWREPAEAGEIYGVEKRIEQRLALAENGQPLGFEIVSFEFGSFGHSWLCNYLHIELNKLFGIQQGQYGLMQSEQDARRVYEWIKEDKMSGHRAEPVPYDYWLLVEYPLVQTVLEDKHVIAR